MPILTNVCTSHQHITQCVHFSHPNVCTLDLLFTRYVHFRSYTNQMCALQILSLPNVCTSDLLSSRCVHFSSAVQNHSYPSCVHFRSHSPRCVHFKHSAYQTRALQMLGYQMCALQMIRRPDVCTSDRLTTRCVHFR